MYKNKYIKFTLVFFHDFQFCEFSGNLVRLKFFNKIKVLVKRFTNFFFAKNCREK